MMAVRLIIGDCREALRDLPDESVHCCVTSPPYFGLRSYLPDGHEHKHREMGSEPTPEAFIAEMVAVFREVRRVLRGDGTLWLNLGDSYASSPPGNSTKGVSAKSGLNGVNGASGRYRETLAAGHATKRDTSKMGAKPKDLLMIPARVALALQQDGWWLRSDIIWVKPNPMPESVTDRPTSAYEHVFLLTKSARYFYDAEAVKEAAVAADLGSYDGGAQKLPNGANANGGRNYRAKGNAKTFRGGGAYTASRAFENAAAVGRESHGNAPNEALTRNLRNVLTVATAPYAGAHFATFPPKLIEPFIKAGTSEKGCCPTCGKGWVRVVETKYNNPGNRSTNGPRSLTQRHETAGFAVRLEKDTKTLGWRAACDCPELLPRPAVVLDPFAGAGTVGLVADRLGRDAILIDLSGDYAKQAIDRIKADAGLFAEVT